MFLFDADKAANGGIFRELWAIVRNFAMTSGLRLAAAIIVLLLGLKIAKAVLKRYEKSRAFQKIVPDVRGVVRWLAGFLLYALIIVLVIGILGIPLASVATIISSAAIAVGLALQGSLSNLAGGIVILAFKPFHVGEAITERWKASVCFTQRSQHSTISALFCPMRGFQMQTSQMLPLLTRAALTSSFPPDATRTVRPFMLQSNAL